MARAIDADELLKQQYTMGFGQIPVVSVDAIKNAPTLTPPNEPLTLGQLREMDGQPVFVKWTDNRILPRWYIVGCYEWNLMDFEEFEDYGKWLAYRRPPEGEAK